MPETEPNGRGYRVDPKKSFATVVRAAGVSWCTPHILRHTFASQCVIAGIDLYRVSQWLGHSSITTTQIYAHLLPGDRMINKMLSLRRNESITLDDQSLPARPTRHTFPK
jgi:integrase